MRQNPTIDPNKVALYVRWSTDDQENGTTLTVQLEGCKHYILSQSWEVREDLIFIDDGYSGASLIRPAMTQLREMVQQGLIDCVVVYKLDRLSRNLLDTVSLVLDEWEDKAYIKSAREPLDSTTPMGKQFFYLLVSFAEMERSVIKERTYSGKLATAKKGRNAGQPMAYGYKRGEVKGTLEIIEEQANIVRRIYHLYSLGQSVRVIAHALNNEGVRSQKGGLWTPANVGNILKNELYVGRMVFGRTTKTKDRSGKWVYGKNDAPLVSVESDAVPPIIEKDVFESIQHLRVSRSVKNGISGRALGSNVLLAGITRCGFCGKRMQLHENRGKLYFRCWSREDKGHKGCHSGHALVSIVTDVVMERIHELFISKYDQEGVIKSLVQAKETKLLTIKEAISNTERNITSLKDKINRLTKDYLDGELPGARYDKLVGLLETELTQLQTQCENLNTRLLKTESESINMDGVNEMTSHLRQWESLSVAQQKTILHRWVKEVRLFKPVNTKDYNIDVTYAWHE